MPSRVSARGLKVLLVVEDDGVRRSLQLLLEWDGFEVRAHMRAASVIELNELGDIQLLVTDYLLPDGNGIMLLNSLRERDWAGRAVLIVDGSASTLKDHARKAGFTSVLEKPIVRQVLIDALTK